MSERACRASRRRGPRALAWTLAAACLAGLSAPGGAQTIMHTPWEMHRAGRVALPVRADRHGAVATYQHAPPIPVPGLEWTELTGLHPGPLNPVDVHYLGPEGNYSSALRTCLTEADFTYFQTFVAIPANIAISEVKMTLGPADDGARVVIFNAKHPDGIAPDGGYVFLGETGTRNLAEHFVPGQRIRVVVQHLDDCAGQSWIHTVSLSVNGETVGKGRSWGALKSRYK